MKTLILVCSIVVMYGFIMMCTLWGKGDLIFDIRIALVTISLSSIVFWVYHYPGTPPDQRRAYLYPHLLFSLAFFEIMYLLFYIGFYF
jgi:hypothetical protein